MTKLPHPSEALDRYTLRRLTYAERTQARAARKAWLAEQKTKKEQSGSHMHCQICGRLIFANSGKIAHHGYERPGNGWQTASCEGARELPFEVSRDALGQHNEGIARKLSGTRTRLASIEAEEVELRLDYMQYDEFVGRRIAKTVFGFTRANFEELKRANPLAFRSRLAWDFDQLKSLNAGEQESEIRFLERYLLDNQIRFNGWTQTHKKGDKRGEWVKLSD